MKRQLYLPRHFIDIIIHSELNLSYIYIWYLYFRCDPSWYLVSVQHVLFILIPVLFFFFNPLFPPPQLRWDAAAFAHIVWHVVGLLLTSLTCAVCQMCLCGRNCLYHLLELRSPHICPFASKKIFFFF